MIYAVHVLKEKYVKIGYSANEDLSVRIAALQTGCPFEILPLFTVSGTLRQEQTLHASLSIAFGRIKVPIPPNEWYPGRNIFFQKFLEYLRYGPDAGLAIAENYNPAVKQPGHWSKDMPPNYRWPGSS